MSKNISNACGLNISGHKDIDFVDVKLNKDTVLFIDPCLIECCDDAFSKACSATISDYFKKLYSVYKNNSQNDILVHLGHLGERNEARLGYGNGHNGKAKTAEGMNTTLSGLHCLIQYGLPMERAIDIPLLMPGFAEDCMSDMLLNILYKHFSEYTIEQCQKYGIPTKRLSKKCRYWDSSEHRWNVYDGESLVVDGKTVLLIPKRYVCKRLCCSTGHFFMSKIAPLIQKRETVVFNGKEKKPNKIDVKKAECKKHGSVLGAVLANLESNPELLSEYHLHIPQRCAGKALTDDCLDKYLYDVE